MVVLRYTGVPLFHPPQLVRLRLSRLLCRISLFLSAPPSLPRLFFPPSLAFTSGITYVPSRDDTGHWIPDFRALFSLLPSFHPCTDRRFSNLFPPPLTFRSRTNVDAKEISLNEWYLRTLWSFPVISIHSVSQCAATKREPSGHYGDWNIVRAMRSFVPLPSFLSSASFPFSFSFAHSRSRNRCEQIKSRSEQCEKCFSTATVLRINFKWSFRNW